MVLVDTGYLVNCKEYNLFNSKVDLPNWYAEQNLQNC